MSAHVFQASVAIFTRGTQACDLHLPRDHQFVIFSRGATPEACPIDEPGTYHISLEMLRATGGGLPICIATVRAKHVAAWVGLSIDAVDRMMDRVERTIGNDGATVQ